MCNKCHRGHLACPYCVIVCRYICIVPETIRGSGVQLCNQPAVWDNLLVLLRYMTLHHAMQQQPLFLSYIWKYVFWITFNKSQDWGKTEVIFLLSSFSCWFLFPIGKFCEAWVFESLQPQWWTLTQLSNRVCSLERKVFFFCWYRRANESLCLMEKSCSLKKNCLILFSSKWLEIHCVF